MDTMDFTAYKLFFISTLALFSIPSRNGLDLSQYVVLEASLWRVLLQNDETRGSRSNAHAENQIACMCMYRKRIYIYNGSYLTMPSFFIYNVQLSLREEGSLRS